ncbi:hypothetical protein [Streptomyces sp. SCL15-4]|uniref:hypothetical protein n=1 Tax=Streptomyces sp. SCL15-4 TaxID=2967221 RepID=UPI0029673BA2|nr:hypothetical protein [Streptomyces sp. SCL15-4]
MKEEQLAADAAAAAVRRARYGRLPERVRLEDMTEAAESTPARSAAPYDAEGSWKHYPCLALDLGL